MLPTPPVAPTHLPAAPGGHLQASTCRSCGRGRCLCRCIWTGFSKVGGSVLRWGQRAPHTSVGARACKNTPWPLGTGVTLWPRSHSLPSLCCSGRHAVSAPVCSLLFRHLVGARPCRLQCMAQYAAARPGPLCSLRAPNATCTVNPSAQVRPLRGNEDLLQHTQDAERHARCVGTVLPPQHAACTLFGSCALPGCNPWPRCPPRE